MKTRKLLHTAPTEKRKKNSFCRYCSILLQWCNHKIIKIVYRLLQIAPGCFPGRVEQKKAFFTLKNCLAPYCSRCSRGVEQKINSTIITTPYIENCPGSPGATGAEVQK